MADARHEAYSQKNTPGVRHRRTFMNFDVKTFLALAISRARTPKSVRLVLMTLCLQPPLQNPMEAAAASPSRTQWRLPSVSPPEPNGNRALHWRVSTPRSSRLDLLLSRGRRGSLMQAISSQRRRVRAHRRRHDMGDSVSESRLMPGLHSRGSWRSS